MCNFKQPRLSKWPFFAGNLVLLAAAGLVYHRSGSAMGIGPMVLLGTGVALGAFLSILPFVLEYRAALKLAETQALTTAVSQIENLQAVADQIHSATGHWREVQEGADKTLAGAKSIAERMTAEVKGFSDFLQRANDNEKATLRLEVEKFRRAEADWLQVLVRMLDHVYALHLGALRSGQPNLIEQMGTFQNACRDAARRIGLAPFVATPTEPFDAQRHQVMDGNGAPLQGARIAETIASGYTFQGRLLRPALVRVEGNGGGEATVNAATAAGKGS